jgi:hypothetical protein
MMMLAIIFVLLFLHSVTAFSCPFECEVTNWLDSQDISWRQVSFSTARRHEEETHLPPRPFLELTTPLDRPPVLLHLLPSPTCSRECVSPILTKQLTDSFSLPIIHLHQDEWRAKHDIVCNRLLMRLGRTNSRIYARKTTVRRINGDVARGFLQEHHLWSATKGKHNYGLSDSDNELVAVATFSKARAVLRGGTPHISHELLRFCTKQDGTVVGGITKLVKAFVREQKPDDIVTVVDRDWGTGTGWHALGFETVHVMSPLVMVVNDGARRHLVGAGIQNDKKSKTSGRLGLPANVVEELSSIADSKEALKCLADHGYNPVYDAGVERLMMIVPKNGRNERSAVELWRHSVPTYATSYYSNNSGIAALLDYIEQQDMSGDWKNHDLEFPETVASVVS